jgi:hypothetical protein
VGRVHADVVVAVAELVSLHPVKVSHVVEVTVVVGASLTVVVHVLMVAVSQESSSLFGLGS